MKHPLPLVLGKWMVKTFDILEGRSLVHARGNSWFKNQTWCFTWLLNQDTQKVVQLFIFRVPGKLNQPTLRTPNVIEFPLELSTWTWVLIRRGPSKIITVTCLVWLLIILQKLVFKINKKADFFFFPDRSFFWINL